MRIRHIAAVFVAAATALGFIIFSTASAEAWKCEYHPEQPTCTTLPPTTAPNTTEQTTTVPETTESTTTVPDSTTSTSTTTQPPASTTSTSLPPQTPPDTDTPIYFAG